MMMMMVIIIMMIITTKTVIGDDDATAFAILWFVKRADTIVITGTVANETNPRIESSHDYIISSDSDGNNNDNDDT